MITRPMLAPNDLPSESDLFFPVQATPKLDGIRGVMVGGKLLSRSFKPIPNKNAREKLELILPDGMDGELISGGNFQDCTTGIMTQDSKSTVKFYVFDYVKDSLLKPYKDRVSDYIQWWEANPDVWDHVDILLPSMIYSRDRLAEYETKCLAEGHEGVMLRDPNGHYKCGRSTIREALLYKFKQFLDSEAIIEGFKEQESNANPKKTNELGLSKRSSHKAGMVPAGTLGTLLVRDCKTGVDFGIGTGDGLTKALRQEIWDNRDKYLGKMIKYKYQPHGVKDKPRCPSFQGFRHEDDL